MLLRSVLALAGLSLLSACTIPLWGEDRPSESNPNGGLPPKVLEVPPDLTRPAASTAYSLPKAEANCPPTAGDGVSANKADVEARMRELQDLREKGLLSDQELQEKRKALLDSL